MRKIALFVEDEAHKQFLGALLQRLAEDNGVAITRDWRNARRGHGAVVREFGQYLRDVQMQGGERPDLIVAATDANCKGLRERTKALSGVAQQADLRIVFAVPDPHIEQRRGFFLEIEFWRSIIGRARSKSCSSFARSLFRRAISQSLCLVSPPGQRAWPPILRNRKTHGVSASH